MLVNYVCLKHIHLKLLAYFQLSNITVSSLGTYFDTAEQIPSKLRPLDRFWWRHRSVGIRYYIGRLPRSHRHDLHRMVSHGHCSGIQDFHMWLLSEKKILCILVWSTDPRLIWLLKVISAFPIGLLYPLWFVTKLKWKCYYFDHSLHRTFSNNTIRCIQRWQFRQNCDVTVAV